MDFTNGNTIFLNEPVSAFIHAHNNIIVLKPKNVFLPKKPTNLRTINIFNHTGKLINVNSNSSKDFIFNSFLAPSGSPSVNIEDKRMITCVYIMNPTTLHGCWYMTIS